MFLSLARNSSSKKQLGSSSKMVLMAHTASTSAVSRSLSVSIESYNRNHFQMRIQLNAARRDENFSPLRKEEKEKKEPDRHRLMASTPSSSSPSSSKEVPESDNVLILYTKPGCCLCEV